MKRSWLLLLVFVLPVPVWGQDDAATLALKARKVFKTHCARCHHGEGSEYGTFDVTDHATLVKDRDDEKAVVVPKKLDASLLWQRAGVRKSMPPKNVKERPSDADLDVLRRWIEAGAPAFPTAKPRELIAISRVLRMIRDHLQAADRRDRRYLRYFTLTHLHNNPKVEEEELRVVRAALAKAVNSLTWSTKIVLSKAIDKEQTVFVIDLRELEWDKGDLWRAVLREYPYGLSCTGSREEPLRRLEDDLSDLSNGELSHIRADWFVATATRAPLYYTLLRLPTTVEELEAQLKVPFEDNFVRGRLARAGFAASGVSEQNRLVERHDSPIAFYYWKSYDFKARKARANLNRFPLGPLFKGNPFARQAFDHDGGEMIFGLPNGMQGYYLTDGKGRRINEGPTDVVSDALKTSGTPAIVNGTSCMHCHKHGMIPLTDTVRDGHALFGEPRNMVLRLYPEVKEMAALVKRDEDRFLRALEQAIAPFLAVEEDARRPVRDFGEPVGEVTRTYLFGELKAGTVAAELGLEKPDDLPGMIRGNRALKELGLLPLANGKTIKRDDWEALDGTSLFQDVARELELGTPYRVR